MRSCSFVQPLLPLPMPSSTQPSIGSTPRIFLPVSSVRVVSQYPSLRATKQVPLHSILAVVPVLIHTPLPPPLDKTSPGFGDKPFGITVRTVGFRAEDTFFREQRQKNTIFPTEKQCFVFFPPPVLRSVTLGGNKSSVWYSYIYPNAPYFAAQSSIPYAYRSQQS